MNILEEDLSDTRMLTVHYEVLKILVSEKHNEWKILVLLDFNMSQYKCLSTNRVLLRLNIIDLKFIVQ